MTLDIGNIKGNLVKPHRSAAGASSGGGGTIFFGVWGGAPSTQTFYFIKVPPLQIANELQSLLSKSTIL